MPAASFPALAQYLSRLPDTPQTGSRVWRTARGEVHGRFFSATLTSAFQSVHAVGSGTIVGYEALARSRADNDAGLSLWKLLDHAASDDESIALDRLCRMLHAINFFRQPHAAADADLLLNVHGRLLAAVDSNHGNAFHRILQALDLPVARIILQLPLVTPNQGWLVHYVSDNYRRNGFRLAVQAANIAQASLLLQTVRPQVIKIDARVVTDEVAAVRLLNDATRQGVRIIFTKVEQERTVHMLQRLAAGSEQEVHAQGFFWGRPDAVIPGSTGNVEDSLAHADCALDDSVASR